MRKVRIAEPQAGFVSTNPSFDHAYTPRSTEVGHLRGTPITYPNNSTHDHFMRGNDRLATFGIDDPLKVYWPIYWTCARLTGSLHGSLDV